MSGRLRRFWMSGRRVSEECRPCWESFPSVRRRLPAGYRVFCGRKRDCTLCWKPLRQRQEGFQANGAKFLRRTMPPQALECLFRWLKWQTLQRSSFLPREIEKRQNGLHVQKTKSLYGSVDRLFTESKHCPLVWEFIFPRRNANRCRGTPSYPRKRVSLHVKTECPKSKWRLVERKRFPRAGKASPISRSLALIRAERLPLGAKPRVPKPKRLPLSGRQPPPEGKRHFFLRDT